MSSATPERATAACVVREQLGERAAPYWKRCDCAAPARQRSPVSDRLSASSPSATATCSISLVRGSRACGAPRRRERLVRALADEPPPGTAVMLLDRNGEIEFSSPDAGRWLDADH